MTREGYELWLSDEAAVELLELMEPPERPLLDRLYRQLTAIAQHTKATLNLKP